MIDRTVGSTRPVAPLATHDGAGALPERVGPFRIVGVLGVGGMGVVYDAEQESPHRRVALKVIRDAMLADADSVRRFGREAEVLARLQHPGIAQVYATGVDDGPLGKVPYFAMERVIGEPLGTFAERLDRAARLELFAEVCDAVHYAHQRGVIHRDLKPSNILVGDGGHPKVLDFGVARLTDADVHGAATITQSITATGAVVGTLLYMSPEQLSGDALGIDTRSDVYALGVILYELLSGRHPHTLAADGMTPPAGGGRLMAVANAVLSKDPPSLGTLDRELRGDLETIAAKALEKDPARRYGSAASLASDVRHYLAHEPITARPASAVYQLRKLARRHRGVVAAGAVAIGALVVGAGASVWSAVRARSSERVAVAQRQRAEGALGLAEQRRAEAASALALAERQRAAADAERTRADSAAHAAARERGLAVASAARATQEAAKATAVSGFLQQMLTSADPAVALGRELTVRDVLDSAAQRLNAPGPLQAQPAARSQALVTLASSYYSLGTFRAALTAAESALVVQQRAAGVVPSDRIATLRTLGEALESTGDRVAAQRRYLEALDIVRHATPVDYALEARLEARLGVVAYYNGQNATSDSLLDDAIVIARRHRAPGDTVIAEVLQTRGDVYTFTNRPRLAIPVMREALAIKRAVYRDANPNLNNGIRGLAYALINVGSLEEAETLLRESVAIDRRLSNGHPYNALADGLDRLANVVQARGRPAEAEPIARESLTMRMSLLGAGHTDVQLGRTRLGGILTDLRQYAEAESLYSAARDARLKLYGPNHGAVAASMLDLGRLAQRRGDLVGAERNLREAMDVFERFGDVALAMVSRANLATAQFSAGHVDDGERTALQLRTALRANPSRWTLGILRAMQNTVAAAVDAGRAPIADTLAVAALDLQRALAPTGGAPVAGAALALTSIRVHANDTTGVSALLGEARKNLTPPVSANYQIRVGEAMCALGDPAAGEALRRGLAVADSTPAAADSTTVRYGRAALARCGR